MQQQKKSYHLVGVAGVGMNALAQVLLAQGARVSGSDRHYDNGRDLTVLKKLRWAGVELVPQDGAGVTRDLSAVVVSSAIEADNPDLAAARKLDLAVVHRAQMLANLAGDKKLIAVTGTAGKTTVTGMIGWILEQLEVDPTVVNGGNVINWVNDRTIGSVRVGASDVWVVELDESDRSLLKFDPDWAVITNISKDHFELEEVRKLFKEFTPKVKRGIVGCFGDREPPADAFQPAMHALGCAFRYKGVDFTSGLLGRHNAENAWHAVLLCDRLGLDLEQVSRALRDFKGIERRLQCVGQAQGVTVIDDYAHNPAKIRATWQAVAPHYKRIITVWRPHGFGPLALMFNELVQTFASLARPADMIYLLPVYYDGGTFKQEVNSEQLAHALKKRGTMVEYAQNYDELLKRLLAQCRAARVRSAQGDAVICMGARDPFLSVFAQRLLTELEQHPL